MNKETISNFLLEALGLVKNIEYSVHDYQDLKQVVVQHELKQEVDTLTHLLSQSNFEALFKARCHERAALHAHSSLSFFDAPKGVCNTLYWNIAKNLFDHEPTLGEMLSVLLPHYSLILVPEPQ